MKKAIVVAASALLGAVSHAQAQSWPSKPVRVVTQFTPGGPGDVMTRAVTQAIQSGVGQSIVIENRPGAEGLIAAEQCVKATADGYTICAHDSFTISLLPVISPNMSFDPLKEMAPLVHMGFLGSALLVSNSVPANTLAELFELAKQKPNGISWGSWGPASSPHMYMEWLKRERGIQFLNVPYKSAPFAFQGLQGGEINVAVFALGPSVGLVKAGKFKAVAQVNPARSSLLPNVPTLREAGLPVDVLTWFGLFAPRGTPADVVQRVNAEAQKNFFGNPATVEKFLTSQGYSTAAPTGGTPAAFAAFLKEDRETNAQLAKITGVKLDH